MTAPRGLLVLGGSGMLGHKLAQVAAARGLEVAATVREGGGERLAPVLGDSVRIVEGVDVALRESWERALEEVRPEIVVNCIGAVKQSAAGSDPVEAIRVNSLFPHQLAAHCAARGARLLQISTDCVFSGARGGYDEKDRPDPEDLYGRSKLLGEVRGPGALTVRTSFVGRELSGANGLLEWLIGERGGAVRGYAKAIFSGLTTPVLAVAICELAGMPWPRGALYHVGGDPISKLELLLAINDAFDLGITIEREESVEIDRSLDSGRFRRASGWTPPSWPRMIAELGEDPTPYPSTSPTATN